MMSECMYSPLAPFLYILIIRGPIKDKMDYNYGDALLDLVLAPVIASSYDMVCT